jgi:tRNA threonylcarbamoyladenosine biosynthesis protein TsaB
VLADADALLSPCGIEPQELDALVVGTGPGSFTSIRMGLAAARGLGVALDLPAAGVSTLLAFAGGDPVIDAKRGEVFVSGPAVARPESLDVAGRRLVGDGAVRYRAIFEAAGADVPPDDDPHHLPHAHLLVPHAQAFGPPETIEPIYLRLPDAMAGA